MIYELVLTGKFKKSLKLAKKRGLNINQLNDVVSMLTCVGTVAMVLPPYHTLFLFFIIFKNLYFVNNSVYIVMQMY